MTGMTGEFGGDIIETDQSLETYTRSLLIEGDPDSRHHKLEVRGPIEVYRVAGYTNHIIVVNKCPFRDHDADEGPILAKLATWHRFATVLNPEHEWSVDHFEPAPDARPLETR